MEYKHPAPYRPDYDYLTGIHKTNDHIKAITVEGPHPGRAQHLGGMASYHNYLEDLHYGHGHKVKKALMPVLIYLHYYSETCHDIYKFFAEDALMYAKAMWENLDDEEEKEHVGYFIKCVEDYKMFLENKTEKPDSGTMTFPQTYPNG